MCGEVQGEPLSQKKRKKEMAVASILKLLNSFML